MRHSADLMLPEVRNGRSELAQLLPYARVHRMPRYDPDKDFVEAKAPQLVQTLDMDDERTEVWAKLLEVNPKLWAEACGRVETVYGRREHGRFVESVDGQGRPLRPWRQSVYPTKASLMARVAEARARTAELRESKGILGAWLREQGGDDIFSLGTFFATQPAQQIGPEMGGWLNSEYAPMMVGPFTRQLYLYDLLDMHRKAFEVVNHNPIARAIVSITSTFVLGKGVTAVCEDDQAQDIWDSFVAENDLWHRLRTWVDELAIYGELMPRWAYDRHKRSGIARSVDPATVWEIVTEPVDIEHVYYYHQQYPCVAGDTRIALLDGTAPTIEELADQWRAGRSEAWTYSYDTGAKRIVPGRVTAAMATGEKDCVEVALDNGATVVASWDHPFLLRDGAYVQAAALTPGDRLMPLYRRRAYEQLYDVESGKWRYTHEAVSEFANGPKAKGEVVHHVDDDRSNNEPTNLCRIRKSEHDALTAAQRWRDESTMAEAFKDEWRRKSSRSAKKSWADPETRARRVEGMRRGWRETTKRNGRSGRNNHVVVAVRPAGTRLVYDLTVERWHNFALEAGVFTHNTQYQIYTAPSVPYTRYVIEQIPAEQIIHVKVNCTSGEKRGRSDLFSILGWLKRTKDYYTAEVQRAQAAASFMWDDTVKGNLNDVMAHLAFIGSHPPQPGDVFVHNESVVREFTVSKTPTRSLGDTGHSLIALCGVGAGVPKEYLSVSAAGARATALVATEPAAKRFEDRQYTVEFLLTQLAHKVFRAAGLPRFVRDRGAVQDRWAVEFTFPSIATEDRSAKLNDLNVSEANAWVSHETASGIAAKELGITTYDYENEMDKIQEEVGVDPRTVISGKIPMIRKLETTSGIVAPAPPRGAPQAMPGPDGRPAVPPAGNGAGALGGPTRMTTAQRTENNPLAPEGAAALRKDLSQKEAEGALAVAEPETRRTVEAGNVRPGYRNKWGRQVEASIGAQREKARKAFVGLLMTAVGGEENEDVSLKRNQVVGFGRDWAQRAKDSLLKAGSAAYTLGVAKAKEQAGGDRATPAVHTAAVQEWHQNIKARVDRLADNMERWYDREFKTEGTVPTGDDLRGRFETPAVMIPAGLWTLYQSGFQNALGGAGVDASGAGAEGPVMLDYIAVGDADTCGPCAEAAEGGPYPASEAPLPGEVCDGGDACRCELELAE